MDAGEEDIVDAETLVRVRAQARRVWTQSILFAAALTLVSLLLPASS